MISRLKIVMVGPFGLHPRMTMQVRALPLAKALVARGHVVTMLLPPWQNPEDAGRCWEEAGVQIENMQLPKATPGWFHWRLASHLVLRARELRPDIVHTFKPKAYAGLAHLGLVRRYAVVVDADDWEGPGGWNAMSDYIPAMQRFFTWQERWGFKHAAAVTVASRALETLVWAMGNTPHRVFYLPNGPSRPIISQESDGTRISDKDRRPTILLYTRFFEVNLDRLWQIMCVVRTYCPQARFLIVGKGFNGEEKRIVQIAQSAGWHVGVTLGEIPNADLVYAGWGTKESLPRCFAAADLAIYPFDDTLVNRTKCPVKLMDLLAAGIPVVGDAVGQIAEVIVPGQTGFLVHSTEALSFGEAILDLLASPERLADMQKAAREDIVTRYAWTRLAETAETAYSYALEHARK